MNIDLNLYKVFYTTAKCKNILHAAQELFISQPAVSKSIKIPIDIPIPSRHIGIAYNSFMDKF